MECSNIDVVFNAIALRDHRIRSEIFEFSRDGPNNFMFSGRF